MNDETRNTDNAATAGGAEERFFAMQRIYIKDVSFESPNTPSIFAVEWNPKISMNLSSGRRQVADDTYEVVLTITCEAKLEDRTAFLIELQQAGTFVARGFSPEELDHALGVHCPETLFPFAREAIADFGLKGGFSQILLQPINFEALYRKSLQDRADKQAGSV